MRSSNESVIRGARQT